MGRRYLNEISTTQIVSCLLKTMIIHIFYLLPPFVEDFRFDPLSQITAI